MKRITILLAILISFSNPVLAQTSKADLIGLGMAPELANEIVKGLLGTGDLANNVYLTSRNAANTADLSLVKANASDDTVINSSASDDLILQLEDDANRLITFDAAADTQLDMTFGDGGTTALQVFSIGASTADADDDASLLLSGGGGKIAGIAPSRGGYIQLYGNEVATHGGKIDLYSGSTATADITLGAIDDIIFRLAQDSNRLITFDAASDTALAMTFGDASTTALQILTISGAGGADDDDTAINIAGGSSAAVTEGAFITVKGNETSGAGDLALESGDADGSNILLRTNHANSVITLKAGADAAGFSVNGTGELIGTGTATIGWSAVNAANQACTTTCTTPCVFGMNTGALGNFVGCADATADTCICAGAS